MFNFSDNLLLNFFRSYTLNSFRDCFRNAMFVSGINSKLFQEFLLNFIYVRFLGYCKNVSLDIASSVFFSFQNFTKDSFIDLFGGVLLNLFDDVFHKNSSKIYFRNVFEMFLLLGKFLIMEIIISFLRILIKDLIVFKENFYIKLLKNP